MHITGRCHCGAVSFRAEADPQKVLVCHCADCQQFSGAPFRAVVPVPAENVDIEGQPRHYVKVAQSGNPRAQAFCATCGTQLYATEPDSPKVYNFRLGCVDQRAELMPVLQIWSQSALPWLHELPTLPARAQGMGSPLVSKGRDLPPR